jgi:hypothetical protein
MLLPEKRRANGTNLAPEPSTFSNFKEGFLNPYVGFEGFDILHWECPSRTSSHNHLILKFMQAFRHSGPACGSRILPYIRPTKVPVVFHMLSNTSNGFQIWPFTYAYHLETCLFRTRYFSRRKLPFLSRSGEEQSCSHNSYPFSSISTSSSTAFPCFPASTLAILIFLVAFSVSHVTHHVTTIITIQANSIPIAVPKLTPYFGAYLL